MAMESVHIRIVWVLFLLGVGCIILKQFPYIFFKHLDIFDRLSSKSQKIILNLEGIIPDIIEDNPLYPIIENTKNFLKK